MSPEQQEPLATVPADEIPTPERQDDPLEEVVLAEGDDAGFDDDDDDENSPIPAAG